MFLKTLILLSVLLVSVQKSTAATDKIVCFFASWAGYRNGEGSFKPQNIDASLCTHVYYAFLGVNGDGTLKILDSWNEIDLGGLRYTQALKQRNPNLKVLITIGGYNAGHAILDGVAASSVLRKNLINSCISFFLQYGYDGVDIDWEYPEKNDKANFVKLLQEMKAAFTPLGYILSVTAPGTLRESYDVPQISANVDIINLMTYDYHITTWGTTGLNAPLYGSPGINGSVYSWIRAGASPSKLTLSVPFYGHTFTLLDEKNNDIGAPATTGIGGPYTQNPGSLGYFEICEFYDDWTRVWVESAKVPYKYDGYNWLSYDDPQSAGLKAKYAKEQGLAGVAVWSIDTDDFHGACGEADPMLHAIKNNLD